MSNIVTSGSGDFAKHDAHGAMQDTDSSKWTPQENHFWWDIEDLPSSVIRQMHQNQLFPSAINISSLEAMETESVSGRPHDAICGWMVGPDSVCTFKLLRSHSASADSWTVSGTRMPFAKIASRYEDEMPFETPQGADGPESEFNIDPFQLGRTAFYLPTKARRYLLTVKIVGHKSSLAFRDGEKPRETVRLLRMDGQQAIAMQAIRECEPRTGELAAQTESRLKTAPWNVTTLRGSFG